VIQPAERPRIIGMHGAVATVTFGQITAAFAVGEATRLAYEHGIGAVGAIRCCHVGRFGAYAEQPAREGCAL
jgi:LDH2 family malate/lactate/ureidoglycolate dehydrogenase